jgi:hypothetical protein
VLHVADADTYRAVFIEDNFQEDEIYSVKTSMDVVHHH